MIRSNVCPYCGAPYRLYDPRAGDCCDAMRVHARLVREAADADVSECCEVYATADDIAALRRSES